MEFTLDKLDGVEEKLAACYVEADGKFTLDVDKYAELKLQQSALKANADKILSEKKALEKKLADADKAAKEAAAKAQEEYEAKLKAAGDIEGLKKSCDEMRQKAIAEKEAELSKYKETVYNLTVKQQALSMATASAVNADVAPILAELLERRMALDETDNSVYFKDKDGNRTAYTADDYIAYLKNDKSFAYLLAGSNGSGGGGAPNIGGGGGAPSKKKWEELTGSEKVKLHRENPQEYERLLAEYKQPKK